MVVPRRYEMRHLLSQKSVLGYGVLRFIRVAQVLRSHCFKC